MILGEGVTDEEIIAVRERDARNEGLAEGIEKGLAEKERLACLTELLLSADRLEDLKQALVDETYQHTLYEELGL